MGEVTMRNYQLAAFEAVRSEWRQGRKRTVICLPTGTGKCCSEDTYTWSGGLTTMGELFAAKATRIMGPGGVKEIAGWHDDGVREGLKATLECGLTIDGTHEHRIWCRRDNGFEGWVKLGELQGDEYAAVAVGQSDWGNVELPVEQAYTLGCLFGGGRCFEQPQLCASRLRVSSAHLGVLELIKPVLEDWAWGASPRKFGETKIYSHGNENYRSQSICLSAPNWAAYLSDRFGIDNAFEAPTTFPKCILQANKRTVIDFLKGFFDIACTVHAAVRCYVRTREIADQIVQFLLALGIRSSVRSKGRKFKEADIIVHSLAVFNEVIGLTDWGDSRSDTYSSLLKKRLYDRFDTVPGMGFVLQSMSRHVDRRTKNGGIWSQVQHWYYTQGRPTRDIVRQLAEEAPNCPERAELERIAADAYAWHRIIKVEPSTCHRVDCFVPDGNAYLGNGLVNHNTVIFLFVIYHTMKNGLRCLVLCNTDELVNQAKNKLELVGIKPGIVKAGKDEWDRDVVVASIQTISRTNRLENIAPNFFGVIITDECHFANSPTYQRVLQFFDQAWHLGVTATPFRGDKQSLAGAGWDSVAYVYSLQQAITDGWLCKAEFIRVDTGQELKIKGKTKDAHTGEADFAAKELERAINNKERNLKIVQAVYPYLGQRKFLAFCAGVNHAVDLANAFRNMGVMSYYVSGNLPIAMRRKVIEDHALGRFPVLTNCQCLTHGYDDPALSAIIMARPTQSKVLYIQEIGRGLRPYPGKETCLIFDVVDVSGKHSLQIGSELMKLEESIEERNKKEAAEGSLHEEAKANPAKPPPGLIRPLTPIFDVEALEATR